MKFLAKTSKSQILSDHLDYKNQSHRNDIRKHLLAEQINFCAYSERYIKNTDSVDIEHFDGRLKPTTDDGYYNWYGVISWFNSHKPKKIDPYLPILLPNSDDLKSRIIFRDGIYVPLKSDDIEAKNLINYLVINKQELYNDRTNHLKRIKTLYNLVGSDIKALIDLLSDDHDNLSYSTAIESEFGINLQEIIFKTV